jgi:Protein of unknown function (DUF3616)
MLRRVLLVASLVAACARQPPSAPPSNEVRFTGACDASGAVPLDERTFLVADDEDNVLRVYDSSQGGPPLTSVDLSQALGLPKKKKGAPELDIEAATRVGELAYFITSHGRNSSGKLKPERLRFFATTAAARGTPELAGRPYERLLEDLLAEPRLAPFNLAAAAELAPKAPGGLNLEGMTARFEGGVWLGFRNPLPEGRALLVPLLNPEQLIEGQAARFGDPLTLDLGGLGVRALSSAGGRYLIAAGAFDSGPAGRLFTWQGTGAAAAVPVRGVDFSGYNPEAFFSVGAQRVLILSDDGSVLVGGTECKKLDRPEQKRFRGLWIAVP